VLHPTPGAARASPGALTRFAPSARVSTNALDGRNQTAAMVMF